MNESHPESIPRLLLVEDDMVSQGFFQAALESLPARVDLADSLASGLQRADQQRHDLWLIDVNLPDGTGPQLLQRLRARHPGVPALAHTADGSAEMGNALQQQGFCETLVKPLSREALLKAVRRTLARGGDAHSFDVESAVSDWDETAALTALNGQRAHLTALRELFLAELPGAHAAIDAALQRGDDVALRGQLHRLQASCGFVGASRLGRAVRQLHQHPRSVLAQSQFSAAIAALGE
ncbi:hybrid sensor histidine kinase/response regulator [Stenotrophomonas sp. YIM B06876]|uniref:hybrid sensor histidine kinase/response regulator n=1 Tax=Stenotrophomonas sp. YIM B06876 TaxID=3060211 RepID=UPI0027393201|nr:hybrid sensor histidine kinase/response regulator [Stenotrophomonas sp. YIM B06876]